MFKCSFLVLVLAALVAAETLGAALVGMVAQDLGLCLGSMLLSQLAVGVGCVGSGILMEYEAARKAASLLPPKVF